MTEPTRRKRFEARVVFDVRRGHDDGSGTCILEDDALESGQARRVHVFDDLDGARRVVPGQAAVPICEGALEVLDAIAPRRR